ncbi:hypothetical protein CRUP_009043 [Coryphaenoides rupestris]|nr:hypothetical protein CRUP_009043 [Coryphaenoides rupestris]
MFEQRPEFVMELTFAQAAKGVDKEMTVNMDEDCQRCGGKGSEPGTKVSRCNYCHGTGKETVNTGPFMMRSTCRRCGGRGTIMTSPCVLCRGEGQTKQRQTVKVPVPAGVEDGQTVRMSVGKREIHITFRVQRSPVFKRNGVDIHSDALISVAQAILGGTARTQGLYETITMQIPAGCPVDQTIRLQGKGIRKMNSYVYGDHYVHIKIRVPKKLSRRQKSLMLSYAEDETDILGTVNGVTVTTVCVCHQQEAAAAQRALLQRDRTSKDNSSNNNNNNVKKRRRGKVNSSSDELGAKEKNSKPLRFACSFVGQVTRMVAPATRGAVVLRVERAQRELGGPSTISQ